MEGAYKDFLWVSPRNSLLEIKIIFSFKYIGFYSNEPSIAFCKLYLLAPYIEDLKLYKIKEEKKYLVYYTKVLTSTLVTYLPIQTDICN